MVVERKGTIRSFVVVLYNGSFQERGYFEVPVSVAAPFANRLFREALPGRLKTVREPWYALQHHLAKGPPLHRSPYPIGMTSLYGERYVPEEEPPPRVTLHPGALVSHFAVRLLDFRIVLYQGEYSVDDIFRAGAEYLARSWIEKGHMDAGEGPFFYEVIPSSNEVRAVPPDFFPPEAYQVEGVFQLPPLPEDRERTKFTPLQPDILPERALKTFGATCSLGWGEPGRGQILMSAGVYRTLKEKLELNPAVEDGGYLVGHPYRQPGSPEDEGDKDFRWLVGITDVVQPEGIWGRPALLLFTGDSWSGVTRRLDREFADKKLVAWFHTHLFEASEDFGLSGWDQDLHRRFLTKPWQVAVLLNVNAQGERTVRCFQRGPEGDLVECPFEVFDPPVEKDGEKEGDAA